MSAFKWSEWTGADLDQTAVLVHRIRAEIKEEMSRAGGRVLPEEPRIHSPISIALRDRLCEAPLPPANTPEAVSWFWVAHALTQAHWDTKSLLARLPDKPGDLWSGLEKWNMDPRQRVPEGKNGQALWELCCDPTATVFLREGTFSGYRPPSAFLWAQQHVPSEAQAYLSRRAWQEIWGRVDSRSEASDVFRRLSYTGLPPDAQDEEGNRVLWALVQRHPQTLLYMNKFAVKVDFKRDRSGRGHDLWWAALSASNLQNTFTNTVFSALKRLGAPEVGPEGKGWLVAHPEWVKGLTAYANPKGGVHTNHAVRRRLHALMSKTPEVAWSGTEADHQALVHHLWTGPAAKSQSAKELAEWTLWALRVPADSPVITPSLRGFFIQCLTAGVGAHPDDWHFQNKTWRDPDLWGKEQFEQAVQRLKEHLRLPHVKPEGSPASTAWETLLSSPKALALTRLLDADINEGPAPERRRARFRS